MPEALQQRSDAVLQTLEDVKERLNRGNTKYLQQVEQINRARDMQHQQQNGRSTGMSELADPTAVFGGLQYQFFDMIAVGPFQPIGSGPFRPNRIIRAGEPAFLIAAIWRNPAPLGFTPGNPSAAEVMAGQPYTVRGVTVDVNNVTSGPPVGPVNATFGAGFVDFHILSIPTLPPPADLAPRLLDITLTIDVRSVASGLPPFAGYASQWYQIDREPPFVFPTIPFVGGPIPVPGLVPSFVQDIPVRVLIYS